MTDGTIRVLLCDDADAVRMLLGAHFEVDPALEVVGEASNGLQAIDLAQEMQPDVVVLDLLMPVMDGLQALPEIIRVAPGASVVVLSGECGDMAERASVLGAKCCLQKGADLSNVVAGVKEAAAAP
jgi:DNA-binding NarL/FixJ family response regulator